MAYPERIVPDATPPGTLALHLKRYDFARASCAGADVLDAGCGVGAGAAMREAARVLRPGGVSIVSAPHVEWTCASPTNPFHATDVVAVCRLG